MPISNQTLWDDFVKKNDDSYGGACVLVARRVMEILDENNGKFDCHELICRADEESKVGGITGFMAGCVAQMVSKCHSRGDEFRKQWNKGYGVDEGEFQGGSVNPAILTVKAEG